jgi:hypothetical protein
MAMTGELDADFSDFVGATKEAEDGLRRLQAEGAAVEKAFGWTVAPASLKQIKPAATEAADATTGLKGALGSLGPMVAGAFTVGAVVNFGKAMIEMGSDIQKVAAQTGLAAEEVQRLRFIADQTNVPMTAMVSTVQNLSKAFGENDAGLAKSLKDVGLSFDELKAGSPYDALMAISGALNEIEDPSERAAKAAELLGKNWKELLPGVAAGMKEIGEQAPVMAGEWTAALDDMGSSISRAYTELKVLGGTMLGMAWKDTKELVGELAATLRTFTEATNENLPVVGALAKSVADLPPPLKEVTVSTKEVAAEKKKLAEELAASNKRVEEAARAYEKWKEATDGLRTSGEGWKTVLMELNGSTVEAIKYYLDAGQSQADLAAAYGLTAAQIDAVAKARAAEKSAAADIQTLYAEIAAIESKAAAMRKADEATMAADRTSRTYYEKLAADAQTAYLSAAEHGDRYTVARINQLQTEAQAARETLANWQQAADASMTSVKGAAEQADAAIKTATKSMSTLTETANVRDGGVLSTNMFPSLESLEAAARRPGSFIGQSKGNMVQTNIPWNTPWQQGAGGVMVNASFNYPIMDDPNALDHLAGVVGSAIMGKLSRSGTGG